MEIKVNNVGAVEEFSYPLDQYGLHVLYGRNGAGKTTVLRVLELATNGEPDTRPTKRDGTERGEAFVGDRRIRIAKKVTEEGELGVESLGDLSIAELHSPKFQTAVTRDKTRIATLNRLSGVKASPELFWHLAGGEAGFRAVVPEDALHTDDLVEMSARVKRALEAEARRLEALQTTALADARAHAQIAEGVDTAVPHDERALQDVLEQAIAHNAELCARASKARDQKQRIDRARASLAAMGPAPDLDALREDEQSRANHRVFKESVVASLKEQLADAEYELAAACQANELGTQRRQAAEREVALRAEHETACQASAEPGPTDDDLDAADSALRDAKDAVTTGVKVRQAIAAKAEADRYMVASNDLTIRASRLRGAAAETTGVLTDAIARIEGCPLKVKTNDDGDARLVLQTDRSAAEYYDELSDGEKWVIVMAIAAGTNRLIVLPQAAFGELSPENRKLIHEQAVARKCYVVTAQADDGNLRAEPFQC